ncbi:MAG: transcription-repair coupling factor, partial [Clostridia bacterium]|nr:transcription-repair coupling factor [Clostridia bacterium]
GALSGYSKEYERKRTDTLSRLSDGAFDLLVLSVEAAVQRTVPPDVLRQACFTLKAGEQIDLSDLANRLSAAGYSRRDLCESAGQFSVRGGICDVFPVNRSEPVRIELWGDEIDTIALFDPETQRRTETLEEMIVTPACEILFEPRELAKTLRAYEKRKKNLTDRQRTVLEQDAEALENGLPIAPDRYLRLLYQGETVFDYLKDALMIVSESGNMSERFKSMAVLQNADVEQALENGFLSDETASLWMDAEDFWTKLDRAVILESFPRSSYDLRPRELFHFQWKRSTPWGGDMAVLKEDIAYHSEHRGSVVILAGEMRGAQVLRRELVEQGIPAVLSETKEGEPLGVTVMPGGLSSGFEIPSARFLLVTHRHIAGETPRKKRVKTGKGIGSLEELHEGDYVVHEAHGIGVFAGIQRITNEGVTKDYLKIRYAGSDVLYIPVTQLDLVSKYIGAAENSNIRLNRLGGSEWQKTRKRVKTAVRDMARQLTALYAKRMSVKGYAFSPDTDLQNDFERRFEYEETEDQLRCVNEIKRDMEREVPMDRLLCGDVGFGKTEVALRAAFKCISEGKQCALLVPTTILSLQHYNTILRRFGEMPVTVGLLNRFVSKKEQTRILKDLACGRLDMVVGTHRLISQDVAFRNIGLVIIDEEQRFGVAQKERLKERYPFVDILTLSATPIPRTLNMAMSGLRDMSSIDEAPGDRHPVQTYVLEYNTAVLTDAIGKELRRGGQVYYLHNRIDTIGRCAAAWKQRLPEASIGVAHGRMSEDELTEVWRQLLEHEIDMLICTTIIETGVDVPNANTLIIDEAEKMGLAQLHQLRGRVGRSPRRAYAYFCFRRGRELSEVATKRLEAIREYTEFGSGFKIAMRDLEIRGAGSILGGEQHGNMESVGYELYLKLLNEAVSEEKGQPVEEELPCTVDLNISAHIPERYIASLSARIGIYKRIAAVRNEEDARDVIDELCDRFGEPPAVVIGLINVSLLRSGASAAGITEITEGNHAVILHCGAVREETAACLAEAFGDRFTLRAKGSPAYVIRLQNGQNRADFAGALAQSLTKKRTVT